MTDLKSKKAQLVDIQLQMEMLQNAHTKLKSEIIAEMNANNGVKEGVKESVSTEES